MLQSIRTARGVMRSLGLYYGHRKRNAAMDERSAIKSLVRVAGDEGRWAASNDAALEVRA